MSGDRQEAGSRDYERLKVRQLDRRRRAEGDGGYKAREVVVAWGGYLGMGVGGGGEGEVEGGGMSLVRRSPPRR